jgi:hypothetical protein
VPVHALPVKVAESQWLSASQLANVAGVVAWSHFQGPAPLIRHPFVGVATSFPPVHLMAGGDGVVESAADIDDAKTRPVTMTTVSRCEMRMGRNHVATSSIAPHSRAAVQSPGASVGVTSVGASDRASVDASASVPASTPASSR